MNPVMLPWAIAAGLLTADDVVHNHHLPIPSRFLASFAIFGVLGALADTKARPVVTLIAWGLDVAIFMNFASAKAPVLSTVGAFLGASGQQPSADAALVSTSTAKEPTTFAGGALPSTQGQLA